MALTRDHMLSVLHAKATPKNLKPTVWKGFIEDLKRPEKYNLIFISSGSFCLIIDPVQVEKSLKAIYDHLSDDSIFLFEAETMQAVPEQGVWRGSVWPKPNGPKIILSQLATMQDDICTSLCKYELMDTGKIIHTEIEELRVKIYKPNQVYTGITKDLKKRLEVHNSIGYLHTSKYKPWQLIVYMGFKNEAKARQFKKYLKYGFGLAFAKKRLWWHPTLLPLISPLYP